MLCIMLGVRAGGPEQSIVEKGSAMATFTKEQVQLIVKTMAKTAEENRQYFSDLDAVMGDGDFGESLAIGFGDVMSKWDSYDMSSIGSFLLGVTTAITSSTGGCSGAVWGTLFMRTGMAFNGKNEITLAEAAQGLESAIAGISKRGGAVLGDKTLLDALDVIAKSLAASAEADDDLFTACDKAAAAAVECKDTTKDWVAKRGRQFFTGDRSIGTYDPGIVAIGIMAQNCAEALKA